MQFLLAQKRIIKDTRLGCFGLQTEKPGNLSFKGLFLTACGFAARIWPVLSAVL